LDGKLLWIKEMHYVEKNKKETMALLHQDMLTIIKRRYNNEEIE